MSKPNSPQSLARQILAVLNLPQAEKERIRKQGRKEVRSRFDWNVIAKQHLNYYKSLISKYR